MLDRAIREGTPTVDLLYRTPPTAPATMQRLHGLLREVYDRLVGQVLLSTRPPDTVIALQDWYLGEFRRQGAGEQPTRWTGPLRWAPQQEVS